MKWTKQILLVFSIIATQTLVAQSSIEGYVYNKKDNTSVEYATVTLLSTDSIYIAGASTNESGYFNFHINRAAKYIARISCIGYDTEYKNVDPTMLDSIIYIPINENINQLSEIFIEGKRPPVENMGDKVIINIDSYINTAGKNTLDILRVLPGISFEGESFSLTGKSITVYINDRIVYMTGKDLTNYLSTLQGNQIEKVELLLNPTAKYDAGYNGAIINIKLRRKPPGLNGSLSSTTAAWGHNKYTMPSFNLNLKKENLDLYAGYTFLYNDSENIIEYERKYRYSEKPLQYNEKGILNGKMRYHSYNIGVDYSFSDKHNIGLLFRGINNRTDKDNDTRTNIRKIDVEQIDSLMISPIKSDQKLYNYQGNINYKWNIDTLGSQLSVDLNYMNIKNRNTQFIPIYSYLLDKQTEYKNESGYGQHVDQKMKLWSYMIDYGRSIFKDGEISIGFKYDGIKRNNFTDIYTLDNSLWSIDLSQSNIFNYKEDIYAAYLTFSKAISKFYLSAGIRWELTRQKGEQKANNKDFVNTYSNWFPSVSAQYNMKTNQSLTLSYTRKISRPAFSIMNPFRFYTSPQTYQIGSSNLKPSYNGSVSMRYTKNRASITLLFSSVKNEAVQEATQDDETKILAYRYINFGSNQFYQTSIFLPITFTEWWSASFNISGSYKKLKSMLNNKNYEKDFFYYNASLYNTLQISKGLTADLYFTIISDRWNTASFIKTRGYMEASITKELWNKKASVSLGVTDPFRWSTFRSRYLFQNIDEKVKEINNSRIIKLNVIYKFGSNKTKKKPERNTGVEETQQRIN